MRLEEYLAEIENCPDSLLTAEYGIYDNYEFLVKTDREKVLRYFRDSKDFTETPDLEEFNYNPGTVLVEVTNLDNPSYQTGILLFTYQGAEGFSGKRAKDISIERSVANVILKLGKWILGEKIPTKLPCSVGSEHLEDKESRIIIYDPKTDNE